MRIRKEERRGDHKTQRRGRCCDGSRMKNDDNAAHPTVVTCRLALSRPSAINRRVITDEKEGRVNGVGNRIWQYRVEEGYCTCASSQTLSRLVELLD